MDAVVEVATASVATRAVTAVVIAVVFTFIKTLSQVVATFTTHVPSMGNHSISAVAPDSDFSDRSVALGNCA